MFKNINKSNYHRHIMKLQNLDLNDLRDRWVEFHRSSPPKSMSRELLIRALAYDIQVTTLGGLRASLKKRLGSISNDPTSNRILELSQFLNKPKIKLGTQMIRTWKGETHSVITVKEGFEYRDQTYTSLSKIACLITGTKWSGPAFFGLKDKAKSVSLLRCI